MSTAALALASPPGHATPTDSDREATAAIGRAVGPDVYGAAFMDMRDGLHPLDAYKGNTLILYF